MGAVTETMLDAVTSGISTVISWVGSVITAIVGENGAMHSLLPLFAVGIAISAVLLGVKIIKGVVWGA